jgi:hypothetical protein
MYASVSRVINCEMGDQGLISGSSRYFPSTLCPDWLCTPSRLQSIGYSGLFQWSLSCSYPLANIIIVFAASVVIIVVIIVDPGQDCVLGGLWYCLWRIFVGSANVLLVVVVVTIAVANSYCFYFCCCCYCCYCWYIYCEAISCYYLISCHW